jgi:hypothetical protein
MWAFVLYISYSDWYKTKSCFVATAFELYFRMCHYEDLVKPGGTEIEWDTSAAGLCWWSKCIGR